MFLRPQHFQVFSRHVGALVADARRRAQSFFWGISRMEVAEDQLDGFTFALRGFEGFLKDGTHLRLPTNLSVDPRGFKEALDAAGGGLEVHLGVPVLRAGEPNTVGAEGGDEDLRYRVATVEVSDEDHGGGGQQIEVRKLNGRLFFGDESREGYESLPIARVKRAGHGSNLPRLDPDFIPPAVDVGAWPRLRELAESVLHRTEAKFRFIKGELDADRIALDVEGVASWQPLFKLQIVGSFLQVLRQLIAAPGVHPFALYLELARMAGELSIFESRGLEEVDVPLYDQDSLGPTYRGLVRTLERLLEQILTGRFVRVDLEPDEELLVARLEEEWLRDLAEVYVGIHSDLEVSALLGRIETVKIAAPSDLERLRRQRLFGLDIELSKTTPPGLPARGTIHYFRVNQQDRCWQAVTREREIAVSGGQDPRLTFSLYLVSGSAPSEEAG